jgi:hypothetical protein
LKLSNAALLQTLKNAILKQNRLEFKKKSEFWPLKWPFFKNVALEPIWVGHGCTKISFKNLQFGAWKNNFAILGRENHD